MKVEILDNCLFQMALQFFLMLSFFGNQLFDLFKIFIPSFKIPFGNKFVKNASIVVINILNYKLY